MAGLSGARRLQSLHSCPSARCPCRDTQWAAQAGEATKVIILLGLRDYRRAVSFTSDKALSQAASYWICAAFWSFEVGGGVSADMQGNGCSLILGLSWQTWHMNPAFFPLKFRPLPPIPLLCGGFSSAAAYFLKQDPIFPAMNFQSFPLIRGYMRKWKRNIDCASLPKTQKYLL